MIRLENIVRGAVNSRLGRLLLVGAVAATMYACDGKATPTPVPTEPTRPAATVTFTPTAEATKEPYNTPTPKAKPTEVPATPTPRATETPIATSTPAINSSYDFAKSLGLEAIYLKDIVFDSNSRGLVSYLASLPVQMRTIAEGSGLLEQILTDKKVDAKESLFFNKVIDSYKKEIETMKPWLNQLPENEVTAAIRLVRILVFAGKIDCIICYAFQQFYAYASTSISAISMCFDVFIAREYCYRRCCAVIAFYICSASCNKCCFASAESICINPKVPVAV